MRPPKPHPGQKVRETPLGVRRRALRAHYHLLVLLLASLTPPPAFGKCRGLMCYRTDGVKFPGSKVLESWSYRTCAFSMSCSRAQNRVPSRCNKAWSGKDKEMEALCMKSGGVPSWPNKPKQISVYQHGKADCSRNDDSRAWMEPILKARICCMKYGPKIASFN